MQILLSTMHNGAVEGASMGFQGNEIDKSAEIVTERVNRDTETKKEIETETEEKERPKGKLIKREKERPRTDTE